MMLPNSLNAFTSPRNTAADRSTVQMALTHSDQSSQTNLGPLCIRSMSSIITVLCDSVPKKYFDVSAVVLYRYDPASRSKFFPFFQTSIWRASACEGLSLYLVQLMQIHRSFCLNPKIPPVVKDNTPSVTLTGSRAINASRMPNHRRSS